MVRAGWSPSVRLFEAAACGVPVISDWWRGLDELFAVGDEILVARDADECLALLDEVSEARRRRIARRARAKALALHTADHRVLELERYMDEVAASRRRVAAAGGAR